MYNLAIFIIVIAVILYVWFWISQWRRRIRNETKEIKDRVSKTFKALNEEVEDQVEMLDKKPGITKREKEIRDKLQEALDISKEFIDKEIEDVEKELE